MKGFWVIDIEASGLSPRSYPIEVGLVNDQQEYQALIAPEDSWVHWNQKSGELHGIPRKELFEHGKAAVVVAMELNELVGKKAVYSDHEDWDSFWLRRLFESVGIEQAFPVLDINELLDNSISGVFDGLRTSQGPYTHRALDDARLNRRIAVETLKLAKRLRLPCHR